MNTSAPNVPSPEIPITQDDFAANIFAEIAIPLRVTQTFTYRLPAGLRAAAQVGARALVSFGRQRLTGYIVALHDGTEADFLVSLDETTLKDVEEILDAVPLLVPDVIELTRWAADYYAAPWGEMLKAALPAGLNATIDTILSATPAGRDELARLPAGRLERSAKTRVLKLIAAEHEISERTLAQEFGATKARTLARELEKAGWVTVTRRPRTASAKAKRRKAVRLLPIDSATQETAARNLSASAKRLIDALLESGGESLFAELLEIADASASTIGTLEKRGLVEVFIQEVRRDPLADARLPATGEMQLTVEQVAAFAELEPALHSGAYKTFLLHGVTGSGKTEVYIRAMRAALALGRGALMLVPEIALTPVFSRRLRAHFGDAVAILHSSLSTGERFDEWTRIRRGLARVVIGTRSAIFAPVMNLGLIVVDEEHEATYRQQESPYYNARDLAIVRGKHNHAVVVLGSATPALESFHNAQQGKYSYLQMAERVSNRPMACAEIIDMREVFKRAGRNEIFAPELLQAIQETHARGEQTIILLNRRGYSSFVVCRSCGESVHCPNCDVTLTFHRKERALICHYCNHRQRPPEKCALCQGVYLHYVGEGTEQLEEILQGKFPSARISRLDRDTTAKRKLFEETLFAFAAGEIDLLVGTQMLAKGHDFHNVTLVGVVSVDAGLALPDFRSAERAFQLLTQVAGRAGRGDLRGRVLIQTYHPQHYALRHACAQDYAGFHAEEMQHRRNFAFPPYVALASLLVRGADFTRTQTAAQILRDELDAANTERSVRVLGVAPAPIARIKGEHRLQILLKARNRKRLREVLEIALANADARGVDLRAVNVEIDPVNLM